MKHEEEPEEVMEVTEFFEACVDGTRVKIKVTENAVVMLPDNPTFPDGMYQILWDDYLMGTFVVQGGVPGPARFEGREEIKASRCARLETTILLLEVGQDVINDPRSPEDDLVYHVRVWKKFFTEDFLSISSQLGYIARGEDSRLRREWGFEREEQAAELLRRLRELRTWGASQKILDDQPPSPARKEEPQKEKSLSFKQCATLLVVGFLGGIDFVLLHHVIDVWGSRWGWW